MLEIFRLMLTQRLTPNQFLLLSSIREGVTAPLINIHVELRGLKSDGWVDEDNKITQKGLEVLISVESGFKKTKAISSKQILGDSYADYIHMYLELFPKGRLPSGKASRADKKNIESNFKWFFQNYEYNWDIVLQATARYVDEFEKKNFLYMRNSQYFISKMSPDRTRESELANYCSLIKSGDTDESNNHFSENVI